MRCSGGWTISGLDLHDPRLLPIAEAERRYLESEYVEYTASSASGAAFCRSAALIVSLKSLILGDFLTQLPPCNNHVTHFSFTVNGTSSLTTCTDHNKR